MRSFLRRSGTLIRRLQRTSQTISGSWRDRGFDWHGYCCADAILFRIQEESFYVLYRTGPVRDQNGRCGRGQNFYVHQRYADSSVYGRGDSCPRRGVRRDHRGQHRPVSYRRPAVSRRFLHTLSAGFRSADGSFYAVSPGPDRPSPGRYGGRHAAQLGAGVRRQFWRRLYRGRLHGHYFYHGI